MAAMIQYLMEHSNMTDIEARDVVESILGEGFELECLDSIDWE